MTSVFALDNRTNESFWCDDTFNVDLPEMPTIPRIPTQNGYYS